MYVDLNIVDLLCKGEQGYKHEQNYQSFGGCVYHSYWWFFPLEEDLLLCMFNGSWGGGFGSMRRRGNRLFFCFRESVQHLSFLEFWTGNLIRTYKSARPRIGQKAIFWIFWIWPKNVEFYSFLRIFSRFPGFETNIARNPRKRKL